MSSSRKSHDILRKRHLVAAWTRPTGRGKGQLSVGSQAEVRVRERLGDLAQESEAVEDERQAVAEEAARDLDLEVEVWRGRVTAVTEPPHRLATANALAIVDSDRARHHVRIGHVDPRPDAQNHPITGELRDRRRCWIVRRLLVRAAVGGEYDLSGGDGDQALTVATVAGQTGGVADPGAVLPIEPHPVDSEALRDDLVAVHDEQAPTMMCVLVAAALVGHPDAAARGRTQLNRLSGQQRDATDPA